MGVGRQYIGEIGKTDNGIVVVTTHLSLARLHRKTLCYSKSIEMIKCSVRLLLHYLRFRTVPIPA